MADSMLFGVAGQAQGKPFGDAGSDTYGVVDEIMGRALITGALIVAARRDDIPGGGSLPATLRYPV